MATRHKSTGASGERTNVTLASGKGNVRVKFGSVVVTGPRPSKESVAANVARSTEALERLAKRIVKPGIRLRPKKDVPLYWVDERDPDLLVRQLNGERTRGRLVDGFFQVVD